MSELNACLTTKYGILFAYTKVLIFPQSTKFLGKKTKIISLYMSVLHAESHIGIQNSFGFANACSCLFYVLIHSLQHMARIQQMFHFFRYAFSF